MPLGYPYLFLIRSANKNAYVGSNILSPIEALSFRKGLLLSSTFSKTALCQILRSYFPGNTTKGAPLPCQSEKETRPWDQQPWFHDTRDWALVAGAGRIPRIWERYATELCRTESKSRPLPPFFLSNPRQMVTRLSCAMLLLLGICSAVAAVREGNKGSILKPTKEMGQVRI